MTTTMRSVPPQFLRPAARAVRERFRYDQRWAQFEAELRLGDIYFPFGFPMVVDGSSVQKRKFRYNAQGHLLDTRHTNPEVHRVLPSNCLQTYCQVMTSKDDPHIHDTNWVFGANLANDRFVVYSYHTPIEDPLNSNLRFDKVVSIREEEALAHMDILAQQLALVGN